MTDTTTSSWTTVAASPWRRIAAYFLDYFVFIVPLLGLLSLAAWACSSFDMELASANAWLNHGMMIVVLTLPIVLYFAICESSRFQGTVGKRLMRVVVVTIAGRPASLKQTLIRAIVKLLPWEFFHAIYWRWEGWPMNPAPPTTFQQIAMTTGWLVVAWFVLSLFVGSHRTPYDRIAGTAVTSGSITRERKGRAPTA